MLCVNISTEKLLAICKGDRFALAEQLQRWEVIPRRWNCKLCGSELELRVDNSRIDGLYWRCNGYIMRKRKRTRCSGRTQLRTGTFFAGSRLTLYQILGFVRLWVLNLPLLYSMIDLEIANHTAVDWASFCREVVLDFFIVHKEKLGGVGKIVEIDESKFGKRKYHRGHVVEGQWVFGGYERGSGRIFMVTVEDRSADTLLPIIRDWIEPGTTIISDYWKSYDCLSSQGYEHLKVNHSLNFKDPDTGAHTNAIESSWRASKSTISSSGRRKSHIPGNLARYMFQKRCAELKLDRFVEFLRLAGILYNPLSATECPRDQNADNNLQNDDSLRSEDATDESDIE